MKAGKSELDDRSFWLATENEIKSAHTTDIYFKYAVEILEKKGIAPEVIMQVYARALPYEDNWGIVTGIYEVAKLLEGLPIDVKAMEEGAVFQCAIVGFSRQ